MNGATVKYRIGLLLLLLVGLAAALDTGTKLLAMAVGVDKRNPAVDIEHALPLTCVQAWSAAGMRYPQMLATVTTLAKVSLANRKLTFPNTREAGLEAGRGIADDCKADPDALLFAIVDKHVRRVASAAR
jgi:hypothetical protein